MTNKNNFEEALLLLNAAANGAGAIPPKPASGAA
jgi:hypothetical protein